MLARYAILLVLGFSVVPSIASCRGDTEKSGADAYPGQLSEARCASMGPCCAENGFSFNHDNCVLGGAGFVQTGVDQAKKFGATFDPEAADACISGTGRLARSCQGTSDDQATYDACRRVWSGTKAPGKACVSDLECAPSANGRGACYGGSPSAAGVCVVLRRPASVGDACGVVSGPPPAELADCDPELQCDLGTRTCQPLIDVGGKCPGLSRCVRSAYCDPSGTCAQKLAPDSPCATDGECSGGACIHGKCAHNPLGTPTPCNGSH